MLVVTSNNEKLIIQLEWPHTHAAAKINGMFDCMLEHNSTIHILANI